MAAEPRPISPPNHDRPRLHAALAPDPVAEALDPPPPTPGSSTPRRSPPPKAGGCHQAPGCSDATRGCVLPPRQIRSPQYWIHRRPLRSAPHLAGLRHTIARGCRQPTSCSDAARTLRSLELPCHARFLRQVLLLEYVNLDFILHWRQHGSVESLLLQRSALLQV